MARLSGVVGLHPVALDLDDHASIGRALEQVVAEAGGLEVLVNNAGSGEFGALDRMSHIDLSRQFQTLVFGPMEVIRCALPAMRKRGRGLIINIGSLAGQFPTPYMGGYSAAKAAFGALSWNLQMELAAEHIRVVEILPGDTDTGFHEAMRCEPPSIDSDSPSACAMRRVYARIERNMRVAPPAEKVVAAVNSVLDNEAAGLAPIRVGNRFQSTLAPLLARLVPRSLVRWALLRYYRLTPH